MLRRLIALVAVLAFAFVAEQTSESANWKPVTPDELRMTAADIGDPEADAAILFREGELNDNSPEGTSLKVYIRIKIFTNQGRRHGDVQLPYRLEQGKITDVQARTIRPDGSKLVVEGRDIYDRVILKTSHGVWRARVFSMPAVEAGSIIEYRYRQIYPKGFRYFALDLQSELFTKGLHYRIQPQAASKFDVRWVSFNAQDAKRFAPVWDGSYNIKAENIPPFRREPLMPPELSVKTWGWLYYSNELETNPDKYWNEYAQRMHDRASYETKPTGVIRRVVDSITLSTEGPQEKLARIYNYIQNEIQNIGVAQEREPEAATVPGPKRNDTADETIRRRYGTPREINRLFIAMLRAIGLDARVAELTARDEDFFHRSFPDSFQLNSEVTVVLARDGSIQFYDPGTPYCPLGMLSWEKEAVLALIYGKSNTRFIETPVTEASRSGQEHYMTVALSSDGKVDARVEARVKGQRALELRSDMAEMVIAEQRKKIATTVRDLLRTANIEESSIAISNLASIAAPAVLSYSFSVSQFATRTESRLLLQPALLSHPDESLLPAPRRSNGVYFHYPWSEIERVVIEPPAGFVMEQLPDAVDLDIGVARYQARFAREGERVVYERRLLVNAIIFTPGQYQVVKAFFDGVHQADRTAISFKR